MIYLAYIALFFVLFRTGVALTTLVSRHWLKPMELIERPRVSILIPARNEERSIGSLLEDLDKLDYSDFEVIVYDDSSEDNTAGIVTGFTDRDDRFRLLKGTKLPEGWGGKNHACYRLAQKAEGDYLLFLDADVRIRPDLLQKTLGHLQKHRLSLVSVFPRQRMVGLGEWSTVPLMNIILVSLLPMFMIRRSRRQSLAAANGQFMLFDASVYRKHQYHSLLKSFNVEDIHISRTMKSQGYKIDTLLSDGTVQCRMYHGYGDALLGFTRYTYAFFGGSTFAMVMYTLLGTFGFLFVAFGWSWTMAWFYLGTTILLRTIIAVSSRQFWLWNLLLAPLQQLSLLIIVVESIRKKLQKRNTWKGRTIEYKGN